jgi:hypothetical protein
MLGLVLYQGTTLVGPYKLNNDPGFEAPEVRFSRSGEAISFHG